MADWKTTVEAIRRRIQQADHAAVRDLIDAYRLVLERTRAERDALMLAIEKATNAKGTLSPALYPAGTLSLSGRGSVLKLEQYQRLMGELEREMARFSGYAQTRILQAARDNIGLAGKDARALAGALGGERVIAGFRVLAPEAIEQLLGFLEKDGALWRRLDQLTGWMAKEARELILQGVGMGKNPTVIARELVDRLGMGLTSAMRTMRTTQLYAYREASRANYLANADIIRGWVWYAEVDVACPACLAMHGTEHGLNETLNDHYNGHCTALPLVGTMDNPVEMSGEDWFNGQNAAKQAEILGPGKYEAWKNGEFAFEQLATTREDEVWGQMRVEASLEELVGQS